MGASLLERLPVLAVGVLIALFVGFGIEALYPSPDRPASPGPHPEEDIHFFIEAVQGVPTGGFYSAAGSEPPTPEEVAEQVAARAERAAAWQEEVSGYTLVASAAAFLAGFSILLAVPLSRLHRMPVLRNGAILGGVLTLLYGLALALLSGSDQGTFLAVAATLLAVLAAVYLGLRPGSRGTLPGTSPS